MTESTRPYYQWNQRNDSTSSPFNACSPNLVQIFDFCRRTWGATSLGCHVQRAIAGSGSLSSHAWGAANDIRFPSRIATESAMSGLIAFSKELGVNTIHDYALQRKWDPITGWHSASIGSVGGDWIHVETTPEAFGDGRPVEDRLPGQGQGGDDMALDANDKTFITEEIAKVTPAVWAYVFPETEGVGADTAAHRCNYSAIRIYDSILPQLKALSDKVDALTVGGVDLAVLKQLVRDSVREELDDTLWQSKPAS